MKNKFLISSFLVAAVVFMTACVKDKAFEDNEMGINDPAGQPVGVMFPESRRNSDSIIVPVVRALPRLTTAQTISTMVKLAADAPLGNDVKVTLVYNPALVTAAGLTVLDPAVFTIPSLVVTIPAGQKNALVNVTLPNTELIDPSETYGLGFTITNVEGGPQIARNFRDIVLGLAIKNDFDGVYDMKGYALRAGDGALTGNFTGLEMGLITAGATSVIFEDLAYWGDGQSQIAIGNVQLNINTAGGGAEYPVTITSSGGATNAPGYNSRYDVASKTFFISFTWGAGPTARLAIDTLTYNRPRD